MNGVPSSDDMNSLVSAVDMGFSSVTSVLSDIYSQGEDTQKKVGSILDRVDSVFNKFTGKFDSTVGAAFGSVTGALRNYQKLNYQTNLSILKTMKLNNSLLTKLVAAITGNKDFNFKPDHSQNKIKEKQQSQNATLGGKITNAQNLYQFNLKDANRKTLDSFKFALIELNKFFKFDANKYNSVNKFFKDFYTNLNLINGIIKPVATGFLYLSGALVMLQFVSVINIFKLAMALPLLGVGIGLFIIGILSATKKVGGGPMGAFKMFVLMRSLPEILINLGKGVLYLSIGLILFNLVGYDAIIKLTTSMLALGVAFNLMAGKDTNFSATARLFLVAVMIIVFTSALERTANIKWDSVLKLPVFIVGLGLALKLGGFYQKNRLSVINIIGLSLLMLTFSLLQFKSISWESIIKLNVFIIGLGLALRTIDKNMSIMGVVALGMIMMTTALLDFQELNWMSIIQIIGVVGLLGFVVNKFVIGGARGITSSFTNSLDGGGFKGMGLVGFAVGLMLLAGAVFLFSKVNFQDVLKVIAVIFALGLVIKIFFSNGGGGRGSMLPGRSSGKVELSGMMGLGIGLGLLVLALDAVSEIQWTSVFQLIALIVGIGIAFRIMGPNGKLSGMLGYALGMGILVLALDAMSEISWESVFKLVTFATGLGFAMFLMKGTGFFKMIGFSIAIGIITLALIVIDRTLTHESFIKAGFFVVTVGLLGLMVYGLGKIPGATKGILVALGIGVVTNIMAKALQEVANIKFSLEGTLTFLGGVIVLGLAFTAIGLLLTGPQAIMFALGAGAVLVIALVTYLMAQALSAISALEYNTESFVKFGFGIKEVINAWISLDPIATIASAVTAVATLPILIVSLIAIGILKLMSFVEFDLIKINKFTIALKMLITSFDDNISGWKVTKGSLKSIALLPFLGMMFLSTIVLGKISKTEINPKQVGGFVAMLSMFVNQSLKVLAENESGMKKALPGIKALTRLMNIGSSLAKTVQDIANLRFFEYTVRDGKLVLSGQRSLSQADFDNVGKSLGKLILALIQPLQVIGSDAEIWRIGSDSIRNPFKNDTMLNGIENVKRISDVFKPLVDTIKSYASMKIAQDYGAINRLTFSLKETANAYAYVFWKLSTINTNNAKDGIRKISDLNNVFEDFDSDGIKSLDKMFIRFIDNLSNSNKWKKIHGNTNLLVKNLQRAAKAINSIDLTKAAALEVNVKQFGDRKISENIVQAVEAFVELFGYITLSQQQQLSLMSQVSTNTGEMVTGLQTFGSNIPTTTELTQQSAFGNSLKVQNAINDKQSITLSNNQRSSMGEDYSKIDTNNDGMLDHNELSKISQANNQTNVLLKKLISVLGEK